MQELLSGVSSVLIFTLIIGVLVFIHELGHYLVARRVGAKVEEFALGLGPKIWGFKRGETEYKINLFPLGGYVKILGESDNKDSNDPQNLRNKTPIQKIAVMIAGVTMNFVLAVILYHVIFLNTGYKFYLPESFADFKPVGGVVAIEKLSDKVEYNGLAEGLGAKKAGIPEQGEIKSVNGRNLEYTYELPQILRDYAGKSVDLEICTQACKTYSVVVSEEGKIGITILPNYVHVLTYENNKLISGVSHGVNMVRVMVTGISDIFSQAKQSGDYSKAVNTLSGPVGIYLAVDSVKQYGVISILGLAADLSLVLAFMNLLPIPALDGGRILLTLPELLLRKRLNPKLEVILINGSFILLILLMLAVMVKDIVYFDSLKELFK